MKKRKSVGIASLLNLFFAPIGSLYCHGWVGGVFLIILYAVAIGCGHDTLYVAVVWMCGPIWALMAFCQCKAYNKQLLEEDFRKKLNDKKEG
ncbi:hypothetical protein [uncultured Fibrobacter sp.]|uniref:hypothetical protein n=1 Tax=uncultured Fibrobacter sp. TaxID=261512 RepID=UPI0028045331|nr:hypothetical protein [uncultured Fibrobacter sp.]